MLIVLSHGLTWTKSDHISSKVSNRSKDACKRGATKTFESCTCCNESVAFGQSNFRRPLKQQMSCPKGGQRGTDASDACTATQRSCNAHICYEEFLLSREKAMVLVLVIFVGANSKDQEGHWVPYLIGVPHGRNGK